MVDPLPPRAHRKQLPIIIIQETLLFKLVLLTWMRLSINRVSQNRRLRLNPRDHHFVNNHQQRTHLLVTISWTTMVMALGPLEPSISRIEHLRIQVLTSMTLFNLHAYSHSWRAPKGHQIFRLRLTLPLPLSTMFH